MAIFPPSDPKRCYDGPPPGLRHVTTLDKAHGRIETRTASASAEVVPHLDWPGAAQVMRVERTRNIRGKATTEIAYYVTSLPPAQASVARLLDLNRSHWGVENRLHWRRDVSMSEDRSPGRAGARVMAGLRNLVLSMLRGSKISVPAARENYAANADLAIQAVTGQVL